MTLKLFDVFKKLASDDNQEFKLFSGSTNLMNLNIGKKGWGKVTIAVDNGTIYRMFEDDKMMCMLFICPVEDYMKAKEELEKEETEKLNG